MNVFPDIDGSDAFSDWVKFTICLICMCVGVSGLFILAACFVLGVIV